MGCYDLKMMEEDAILISASYRKEEDGVVVELFGRNREGKSIVGRYHGFKPYFYVVEPPEQLLEKFSKDEEIYNLEDVELWYKGRMRRCTKVVMHSPWKTPKYRSIAMEFCNVLAADIPFHQRFIYDFDLSSCVRFHGKYIKNDKYSVDIVMDLDEIENIEDFKVPLKILSFDLENSMKGDNRIFTIGFAIWDREKMKKMHIENEDERKILLNFVNIVRKEDPDIITGYNIDNYDLEFLSEKFKKYNMDFSIGRDGSKPQRIGGQFWRVHGRVIEDAWWAVKKELRMKRETLEAVSMKLLGEGKEDVDRTRIDEEWKRDKDKVISYCMKDAELALRILLKIGIIDKYLDLATVTKFPLDDVIHSGTSTWVDSLLIREADRNHIGVPLQGQERKAVSIEGGYVHTIEPGLYDWICVLDFKSMYPSIIIKYNICFTTISKDGDIVSPTGTQFLNKEIKEGLIPKILKNLMEKRDWLKRKMKENPERREYYDGLQKAVKVLMNTFYGVLASSFYRFTNPDIGASITALARETIKKIIEELEGRGIKVVYGDTDSIFFKSPYKNLKDTIEFGMRIANEISKREELILEFEKVLNPFFSHGAKKRYVGRIIWPEESRGEMIVRGYEIRRTDSFDLQSEAQKLVFEKILDGDIKGAVDLARDIVEKVKRGDVNIEKLVISRTVRDFKRYKNPNSMANVQAAKKLMARGYEFIPGRKVSWIVINARGNKQDVEPYISGKEFKYKPDYNYYARRIAETLARVTEVFGVDQDNLLTGSKQWNLSAFEKKERKTLFDFG